MKKRKTKENRRELLVVTVVSLAVLAVTLLITNFPLTGFATQTENIIEKEIEIQVFADTSIEITKQESLVRATLVLDDSTLLEDQELKLYLDSNLIVTDKTNSNGYIERNFDLPNTSPGTYSISGIFQGSSTQYLNPSSKEIIIENGKTESMEIQNKANYTVETLTGLNCQEFNENILWSSGYSQEQGGSIKYYSWYPNKTCDNCVLADIEVKARFLYPIPIETMVEGEGYIQISNPNESQCNNPEQGVYLKYLAYESLKEGDVKLDNYCDKNPNRKCEEEITGNYGGASCYGIKTHASQYSIVDVFEIKYKWCTQ